MAVVFNQINFMIRFDFAIMLYQRSNISNYYSKLESWKLILLCYFPSSTENLSFLLIRAISIGILHFSAQLLTEHA